MTIRLMNEELTINSDATEFVHLSDELISRYALEKWAANFSLMTAGYRDHINPADAADPGSPINVVTVAIMACAKGQVMRRKLRPGEVGHVHLGGEVRFHTQTFIQIAARIYAALGFEVHLHRDVLTTPIWYSSFGTFYEEYQSGDNFTASHSPYFKLGWKVLDCEGKELTVEEEEIIEEVRRLVSERAVIELLPWRSNARIHFDLDVDEPYARYQRATLGERAISSISTAARAGFRSAACPLGGSMGENTRRIFRRLSLPLQSLEYFLDSEDPRFHKVGEIGEHNFGADVGKSEVCANTGAPEKLLNGEAHVVLLWDPDGDRLNILTTAPEELRDQAVEFGLKIGPGNGKRMVGYLIPNQLYLLLLDFRISLLRETGLLSKYNWFLGTTYPTSMALEELVSQEGLPTIRVPVGFRYLGELCRTLEQGMGKEQTITTLTNQKIRVGPAPRPLLLCEESGGASMGGPEMLRSKNGRQEQLALREKDGLQLGLLAWATAASLYQANTSMAEQYCRIIAERNIRYRYSSRLDVSLYDESLTGTELKQAKAEGILKRDRTVTFFREAALAAESSKDATLQQLRSVNPGAADNAISPIKVAAWVNGDLALFEMSDCRLIVRASGTDALIRYYIDATNRERLNAIKNFVAGIKL